VPSAFSFSAFFVFSFSGFAGILVAPGATDGCNVNVFTTPVFFGSPLYLCRLGGSIFGPRNVLFWYACTGILWNATKFTRHGDHIFFVPFLVPFLPPFLVP